MPAFTEQLAAFFPRAEEKQILDVTRDYADVLTPFLLTVLIVHLLVRYPKERRLRLALAVPAVFGALKLTLFYRVFLDWPGARDGREPASHNFPYHLCCVYCALKIIEFATVASWTELYTKRNGTHDFAPPLSVKKSDDKDGDQEIIFGPFLRPLELDILVNIWGITRGRRASQLPNFSKTRFALRRIAYSFFFYLLTDLSDVIQKDARVWPPARANQGGSIWAARDGVFGAAGPWVVSTAMTFQINMQINAHYLLLTGFVILLHPNPDIDFWSEVSVFRIWAATSSRRLWSRHWHRTFKRGLSYCADQPVMRYLTPRIGVAKAALVAVLATFAMSGVMHEYAQMAMSVKGYAEQPVGPVFCFFIWQGVAIILEQVFTQFTGRRVGGPAGWIWTYTQLIISGTYLPADIWFKYGVSTSTAHWWTRGAARD